MYKKRIAEKGNREKAKTPAAVQGAMVETWEYTEEDYVFAFGEAVIAAVQRPETHICVDSGASRSECPFGYASHVTAKGTAPPLFSIDGSSIEQRGYKNVLWEKRDSGAEMKKIDSAMVESSVLFPVASVSSLEENGASVVFSCSGDYYSIRQPTPPPSQSLGVSCMKLQKRTGTYWLQADRRVTVDDKSSANTLAGFSPVQDGAHTRGWSCLVCKRGRDVTKTLQGLAKHRRSPRPLNKDNHFERPNQISGQ